MGNNNLKFRTDTLYASVAYLCMKHRGKYDMLALIKALYIAERQSITTEHTSITWDSFVCREDGPVLYNLQLLMNKKKHGVEQVNWNTYFSKKKKRVSISSNTAYDICLSNLPNMGVLSPLQCSFLDMGDEFVTKAPYGKLVSEIHKFCKEWKTKYPKGENISYYDILKHTLSNKYTNAVLRDIASDIESSREFMLMV